ncbi:MAG TPA: N-acetylmuramidase domain-containing protein [Burkholderiales bacterium]|nr:N-acetylmuramidase domain-containing protein [Burkholderiales bacterium]
MNDAASSIGIDAARIWAVISVETSGTGFLPDRRPKILFERHVFSRLTGGKYDRLHPKISDPDPGGYGDPGAHQYERLQDAMALDRDAALKSASWGIGQIMGFNHEAAGFPDVEEMISRMKDSEHEQLVAMMKFLKSGNLDEPLRRKDWGAFAKGYNGSDYAKNEYDRKLSSCYEKYSKGKLPDLDVRAVQLYLAYLGYDPGQIDGVFGQRTLAALNQFLEKEGKPQAGSINADVLGLLESRVRI